MDSGELSMSMPKIYDGYLVYGMHPIHDQTITRESTKKVSTLESFLKSCLDIVKDGSSMDTLHNMIDKCVKEREGYKSVNNIWCKRGTNKGFRLSV